MKQFVAWVSKINAKYSSLANIHNLGTYLQSAFQISPRRFCWQLLTIESSCPQTPLLNDCVCFLYQVVRKDHHYGQFVGCCPSSSFNSCSDSSIQNLNISFGPTDWDHYLVSPARRDPSCRLPFIAILFMSIMLCSSCLKESTEENKNHAIDTLMPDTAVTIPMSDKFMKSSEISSAFLLGLPDPDMDSLFVDIPIAYASRKGMQLQKECLDAFLGMADAALDDGVSLKILSATRNFAYQKGIWERKWNGQTPVGGAKLNEAIPDPIERALKILEYSSMPGTSRHHWGTDFDINAFTNSYFESGEGKKVFDWMEKNASDYGFCRPYTEMGSDREAGYFEEKWHWSYMPLANVYTRAALKSLKDSDIKGFSGAEAAVEIEVIKKYIGGVSKFCF